MPCLPNTKTRGCSSKFATERRGAAVASSGGGSTKTACRTYRVPGRKRLARLLAGSRPRLTPRPVPPDPTEDSPPTAQEGYARTVKTPFRHMGSPSC